MSVESSTLDMLWAPIHLTSDPILKSLGLQRSELVVLDSWDSLVNSPVSWWTRVTNSLVISCKFTEEQSKTRFPFLFYRPKSQEEKPRGRALGCGVLHTASYDQIPDSNVPARE